ncbi:vacuolar protein sorting-associated protein 51 homolog isoform X1 [Dermacentor andersoni]|uniref:vacuolar protein sorting-associated protein 51 homolog isoform X1 n=2 Tax=Dermacentor andersoni TaxID=34620 RepID=UPI0021558C12|nr:vacuolar protein sorting-associated protein 51 homolog isoform X1 [Dermacentor andersoni]
MAKELTGDEKEMLRKKNQRKMLKQFYQGSAEAADAGFNPYDINGSDFNPDLYLNKLLKECTLTDLMDKEQEIYKQIQALDGEMQTLVYENYNKFISATDTIRKMKNDFKRMEEEMDHLSSNMATIAKFSSSIAGTLQGRREQMIKLSSTHSLLKKLQLLFELPPRLKACIENESYEEAVTYYTKAQKVLKQYKHMPSFSGIHDDCAAIVEVLRERLRKKFHQPEVTSRELSGVVELLFQLREPTSSLCTDYLLNARRPLDRDIKELQRQVQMLVDPTTQGTVERNGKDALLDLPMHILEFTNMACNCIITGLCNIIESYTDLFINRLPLEYYENGETDAAVVQKLKAFLDEIMLQLLDVMEQRVAAESRRVDNSVLVKALDRFCQKLQALTKMMPAADYSQQSIHIVEQAARDQCAFSLHTLRHFFAERLTDVRHNLALPRTVGQDSLSLADLHAGLHNLILDQVQSLLRGLRAFVQAEVEFAKRANFQDMFCMEVHEGIVVAFIHAINNISLEFCETAGEKSGGTPPSLLLLLSRFSVEMKNTLVSQLLGMADEQFGIPDAKSLTPASQLIQETSDVAQTLIDQFVRVQGLLISQMLRKSVEARDWMNALEPRNVRAVMKRVVEDVTAVDVRVGQLYEEGARHERSSDSSRRTYPYSASGRAHWSARWPSSVDHSLLSNIQKLFSEKIDIFTTVEFSRVSVMTGIIKIGLKTFLECVRLKTFSRYGLQQVQVDTHYLQLYLWRFVSDENLVHVLLDELMGSAIHRCFDPMLMEPSVVEVICERG